MSGARDDHYTLNTSQPSLKDFRISRYIAWLAFFFVAFADINILLLEIVMSARFSFGALDSLLLNGQKTAHDSKK